MKRLYYLTGDIFSVEQISAALHAAGISDWNFHVLSKDKAGLKTHHIHSSTPLHERDLIHSGQRGGLVGGVIGIVLATGLMAGDVIPMTPMGYFGAATLGGVFLLHGIWTGGLVGLQRENYKVKRFHGALEEGQYLLMIDVAHKDEAGVIKIMSAYPSAKAVGASSTLTTPFGKQPQGAAR